MIVQLMGGLGNQLFQYAFGKSLSIRRNLPVYFDPYKIKHPYNYFLSVYNVDAQFRRGGGSYTYEEPSLCYDPRSLTVPLDTLLVGYWQTEKYFVEGVIRKQITFKSSPSPASQLIARTIRETNSVSLHVRRGDYLRLQHIHGVLPISYYQVAISQIHSRVSNPTFFIFSDDPQWCRRSLSLDKSVIVSEPNRPIHEDLWLMSQCKHSILANSSFSWWGAWLNPEKNRTIICPKTWFTSPEIECKDIAPSHWMKL